MTAYLKSLALHYGARTAGVAALRPYHVYSHVGRDFRRYGEPIPFEPGFAIAFCVEMDLGLVRAAPRAPAVVESARQYVEAARVAVPLAAAIRAMGYPARAHIDGRYQVIAPLVARDAGLGEIGRMGLLMTPRHGPRVRLGVVTTALELVPDGPARDESLLDFCSLCRKCAENCPAQAIPGGDPAGIDGEPSWRVDGDACYRYWNIAGTDCARCVAVCPYAHADRLFHNAVRWGVRRSGLFRRAAVRHAADQLSPLYFEDVLGFNMKTNLPLIASFTLVLVPIVAVCGSVISGWVSDRFFRGNRYPVAMVLYYGEACVIAVATTVSR